MKNIKHYKKDQDGFFLLFLVFDNYQIYHVNCDMHPYHNFNFSVAEDIVDYVNLLCIQLVLS